QRGSLSGFRCGKGKNTALLEPPGANTFDVKPHELEVLMLRRKALLLCLCTVSFLATFFVTSAWSAPDPTANKNAISIDLDCGGSPVVAAGIFQNTSPTFSVFSFHL